MKNSVLPVVICSFVAFSYCKKKDNDPPTQPPAPVVTGIAPGQASAGSDIMIKGKGFGTSISGVTVKINNQSSTVKLANDSVLIVTLPNNALPGYLIISNANGADTSANEYPVSSNTFANKRLKEYMEGEYWFTFVYDGTGKLVTRNQKWRNPINHLFFDRSVSNYTYNGAGQIASETYSWLEAPVYTKRIEYVYTNNVMTGDKVFDVNMTDPANPVSTLTATHDYVLMGRQLLHAKTKNATGALVSEDNYSYEYINGKIKVTRQIIPVAGTPSTEIYMQFLYIPDPQLAMVPSQPGPSYFMAETATFSATPILDYFREQVVAIANIPTLVRTKFVNNNNRLQHTTYTYEAIP
ncbi:IPT/TIG domain-containing protein [Chitinophaga deserti]|uniref:IPT/TIG domain-containing protein n=1 Tax=Chitinophaga deserti TaxID=2164099 RepID=UPI000D6BCBB1|nr:IPT/TIG domain-containing protein [Chitinophaga deserti]